MAMTCLSRATLSRCVHLARHGAHAQDSLHAKGRTAHADQDMKNEECNTQTCSKHVPAVLPQQKGALYANSQQSGGTDASAKVTRLCQLDKRLWQSLNPCIGIGM